MLKSRDQRGLEPLFGLGLTVIGLGLGLGLMKYSSRSHTINTIITGHALDYEGHTAKQKFVFNL